jgi:hypothetical protein
MEKRMERTLSVFGIGLALLLNIASYPAFGQKTAETETVAKADTGENDSMVKMNAVVSTSTGGKVQPVVKMTTPATDAFDSILPAPDGNELAESCKAEAEGFDAGYCLGVVEGVIASMRLCKKDRSAITLGEAADTTAKYLSSHPERWKERDVIAARKALSQAYPCGVSRR